MIFRIYLHIFILLKIIRNEKNLLLLIPSIDLHHIKKVFPTFTVTYTAHFDHFDGGKLDFDAKNIQLGPLRIYSVSINSCLFHAS